MDTRNGDLYSSREAAEKAGVPAEHIEQPPVADAGSVVVILAGPFKGRQYVRNPDGTLGRRLREREKLESEADHD